jgi:hypothetical protein
MTPRLSSHSPRRGVALVITLILLSVILVITFALLAVSRRERSSVTTAQHLIDAEYMANAALERAKATLAVQILGRTNLMAGGFGRPVYSFELSPDPADPSLGPIDGRAAGDLLVSTSTNSFDPSHYTLSYVTNLQFDARVPVFVKTNRTNPNAALDFRHYLDFNRNQSFESNGFHVLLDEDDQPIGTNRFFHAGDPEWLGMLSQPGLPHSATNRFIGRYAFLVVPAGRTLDINAIHNNAKNAEIRAGFEGYGRNQGVGTYEINLAAFLADLNTNQWLGLTGYRYDLPAPWGAGNGIGAGDGVGIAFDHARDLLRYRYAGDYRNLPALDAWLGSAAAGSRLSDYFRSDVADTYADDTTQQITNRLTGLSSVDNDPDSKDPSTRWSGVDNPNRFVSMDELFKARHSDPLRSPYYGKLTQSLQAASTNRGTYNRYTFYRLLSQLGTDTGTGTEDKINLSFKNLDGYKTTDLVAWDPADFFMTVADRLIRDHLANVNTNYSGATSDEDVFSPNFAYRFDPLLGPTTVTNNPRNFLRPRDLPALTQLSVTNIPVFPINYYNSAVHRLLQVSANLYEASTNRIAPSRPTVPENHAGYLPTIYRPRFARRSNGDVVIAGYLEDDGTLLNPDAYPWISIAELVKRMAVATVDQVVDNLNVYGVPPIVATRKGIPSLNEIVLASGFDLSRKLLITKQNVTEDLRRGSRPMNEYLNEFFVMSASNRFGVELINGYTSAYPRRLIARIKGRLTTTLFEGTNFLTTATNDYDFRTDIPANSWRGGLFNKFAIRVPALTNLVLLNQALYTPGNPRGTFTDFRGNLFRTPARFSSAAFNCRTTNEFMYLLFDADAAPGTPGFGRVIDAVSMNRLETAFDLNQYLNDSGDSANAGGGGLTTAIRQMWVTNRVDGSTRIDIPTVGASNQVFASWQGLNLPGLRASWRDFSRLATVDAEVLNFLEFFSGGPSNTNLQKQAPLTAHQAFFQLTSWQANDPLLHHTPEQMLKAYQPQNFGSYGTNYGDYKGAMIPPLVNGLSNSLNAAVSNAWNLGEVNKSSHQPWPSSAKAQASTTATASVQDFDPFVRDPMVRTPDDWDFPTNRLANLGAIGRIHRGTPWQSIYLKSAPDGTAALATESWLSHVAVDMFKAYRLSPTAYTNTWLNFPTNDWSLVDMFTVGGSDSAGAGKIGVNQSGLAAWSAVLSGVVVLTNHVELNDVAKRFAARNPLQPPALSFAVIQPGLTAASESPVGKIVNGINRTRLWFTNGLYASVGQILAVPELTLQSPFLYLSDVRFRQMGISEEAYEMIPRQVLSLIRSDEPRFVIYAFGQALQPAPDSLIKNAASEYYNLCTNYQITAEMATKTVIRFENTARKIGSAVAPGQRMVLRPVVESFEQLPADGF